MSLLKRLDNIDILYTDRDAMLDFYHGVLGLPFFLPHEADDDWFALQAGDVTLFFFPGTGAHPPRLDENGAVNPPGIESIAWAVDDLDAAVAVLDGKVEWVGEEKTWTHPSGRWYRMRTFYDPEGNKVWITEPHTA
ncbi:hypothetical protein ADL00_26735 [Streptomyces sp. AS58]|uniref:Glyoxalase/bleomycin resistance/dioxygenase family protein n=1 Tax=Streptomyces cadmiisoli TaxID=2184053 RepID=A0A2Z4JEX3_9ACTN|nr:MULTISPECIES: VOC family protein [Streptomyces]AWW43490.1 glyoxalase/bleomycin resistance/dioxygenase family protein [Streptomyces cadmiisoli]KOV57641.1 hypothetical protein ADL00_26735 [Streptomyces sp. AS58]